MRLFSIFVAYSLVKRSANHQLVFKRAFTAKWKLSAMEIKANENRDIYIAMAQLRFPKSKQWSKSELRRRACL